MQRIGCVTPFGITKDNICTTVKKAKKAMKIYKKIKINGIQMENISCFEPCSYMSVRIFQATEILARTEKETSKLVLSFNELVSQNCSSKFCH